MSGVAAAPAVRVVGPKDLHSLTRRLWLSDDPAWPVTVTTERLPETHRVAEAYVIAPNLQRPRFLLPVHSRRAVAAAFTRHLSTQSPRSRALGATAGAAWWTGLGEQALRGRLTVGIDRRIPREEWGEWLLMSHLADALGTTDLVGIIPVRRDMPNAKPTVRLLDGAGEARGYAKIGWSPGTRELVRNETRVLTALNGGTEGLSAPRVLSAARWHDHEYHVASPLPPNIGSWREAPEKSVRQLSEVFGSGDRSVGRLTDSTYLRDLRSRLAGAQSEEPETSAVILACLERISLRPAVLQFGRWHGDWVPWNLGRAGQRKLAWDWEYSAPSVPLGFDVLHWHFQQRLANPDGTLERAVSALEAAGPGLASLGVPDELHELTASLYLVEILTRAAQLAARGCGWNPRLYPDLLQVAAQRS